MGDIDMINKLSLKFPIIVRNFLSFSVPFHRSINVATFERCFMWQR